MADDVASTRVRTIGLAAGPMVAAAMLAMPPPAGLEAPGWCAAAVAALMAIWWMSEALPIAITALVPVALFPVLGVATIQTTTRPYADPLVLLLLGGFILAKAIERWSLHARMAGFVVRYGGTRPAAQIGALMVATAFLSMWVSNTAAAMVMLPIGVALAQRAGEQTGAVSERESADFRAASVLGIAYAASIGGLGTLVGTPPNALFAAYMREAHGSAIGFAKWMLVGVPAAVTLLAAAWLVLTRVAFRIAQSGGATGGRPDDGKTGARSSLSTAQRRVIAIVSITALAWLLSPLIVSAFPSLVLSDSGIAITGALALFVVRRGGGDGGALLEWQDVAAIKWDVLLLVGGGLALAFGIASSGLASWIGERFGGLKGLPVSVAVIATMIGVVYLGELASNTAVAAIFLPVAGAAAIGLDQSPAAVALPVAMAASLGFMLPVATPPNAIAYGSGHVTSGQMLRAGAILDVAAIIIVAVIALTLGPLVAN